MDNRPNNNENRERPKRSSSERRRRSQEERNPRRNSDSGNNIIKIVMIVLILLLLAAIVVYAVRLIGGDDKGKASIQSPKETNEQNLNNISDSQYLEAAMKELNLSKDQVVNSLVTKNSSENEVVVTLNTNDGSHQVIMEPNMNVKNTSTVLKGNKTENEKNKDKEESPAIDQEKQTETQEDKQAETSQDAKKEPAKSQEGLAETSQDNQTESSQDNQTESSQEETEPTTEETQDEDDALRNFTPVEVGEYEPTATVSVSEIKNASLDDLVDMVIQGRLGYGWERVDLLQKAGYNPSYIAELVNERLRELGY